MSQIVVLHVPHSSRYIAEEERKSLLLNDSELDRELLRMTDAHTDELFPRTFVEAGRVVFSASRLICDVERFASDDDEPMAARGMGVIYTRTSNGDILRTRPNTAHREALLNRWYRPHHSTLERLIDHTVARYDACLIMDCHSFPSLPLPYELDQREERADFCVGTDFFHTPSVITDLIMGTVTTAGYSTALDAPFSGTMVPLAFYRKDRRVRSVMLEVNRRLYMDERTGFKKGNFDQVRAFVGRLIVGAAEAVLSDFRGG
jgi:N-formylglutamate amidohydrolase